MPEDTPTPTMPTVPTKPVNSFIKGTKAMDFVIARDIGERAFSTVTKFLSDMDAKTQELEKLIGAGAQITYEKEVYNVSFDEFRRVMGDTAADELVELANRGRAFLQFFGYEKKTKVAPSVLVQGAKGTASAMVQRRVVVGAENQGDVDLESVSVVPTSLPPPAPPIPGQGNKPTTLPGKNK